MNKELVNNENRKVTAITLIRCGIVPTFRCYRRPVIADEVLRRRRRVRLRLDHVRLGVWNASTWSG